LLRYNTGDIDGKVRAAREIAGILAKEKDAIALTEYTKIAADKLKVNPETLSAEIKRLGFYQKSARSSENLKKITEKPSSKVVVAEQVLLKASLENMEALSRIKSEIDFSQFSDPLHQQIAEVLFTVDMNPSQSTLDFLMNNLPGEETKKVIIKISLHESPNFAEEEVISDCINTIKSYHLKNTINQMRDLLANAEKQGQAEESARLAKELKNYNDQLRSIISKA
jgi:hypothetical protein